MKTPFANPYVQASFLTAASIGAALLSGNGESVLIAGASLNAAAGVLGNLVANQIQTNQDAKIAADELVGSKSVAERIANIIEAIIVSEKLNENDEDTPRIAELAKHYWLDLHSELPEPGPDFRLPVAQLVSQLLNPAEQMILMPEWADVLRCSTESEPTGAIAEMRLNQLAGALTQRFPEKLNQSFFADLNQGKAGFSEIVLRLLIEIVEVVRQSGEASQGYSSAVARLEMLLSGVVRNAERSHSEMSNNATEILTRLKDFRGEVQTGFAKLMGGQAQILKAVSEVATNLAKPEQGYISALETVAAIHGISAEQLRIVLLAHSTQLFAKRNSPKLAVEAALAAGEFDRAETSAIEWSQQARAARRDSEAVTIITIKEESEALRNAGLAALRKNNTESALRHYQGALALVTPESDLDGWIRAQEGIAGCLLGLGKPDLSLKVILEVHEISRNFHLEDPKRVFWNAYTLGVILCQLGDLARAEPFLVKAFSVAQTEFQREDPVLAASLYSLSVLAMDKQELPRAEEISRKHLGLLRETGRLESDHAVAGFYILGKIERLAGKFSDSEEHHIRALSLAGEHLAATHPQRGQGFNELGLVHQNQRRNEDAEQDFKMAIGIEEAAGRSDSLFVSDYTANLGRLYARNGNWNSAKQYLARSVAIRTAKLGPSHPKTIEVCQQHAQVAT